MNFLAHAFLAGDDPDLVVGGVIGDWIKGALPGALHVDLIKGVALHRAIDSFAERHPAFRASRARVSPARRRYAGVLVDIFYDHVLAQTWPAHHERPLDEYSEWVYGHIADRMDKIPATAHRILDVMAEEDWFVSYAGLDGIGNVLSRMARRTRQPSPLTGGEQEFAADAEGFVQDFHSWVVDAQRYVRAWRNAI